VRELCRIAGPWRGTGGRLGSEYFDHADDGAQQAQQRSGRCNGSECWQIAFQAVSHGTTGCFHGGTQIVLGQPCVGIHGAKPGCQNFAKRRVLFQLDHHIG